MTINCAEKHNGSCAVKSRLFTKNAAERGRDSLGGDADAYSMGSEATAGDLAAGDLICGEGCAVFVGDVTKAVDFGGQLKPADEGVEIGTRFLFCACEADVDDDERHIGYSEMAFGAFPQTELDAAGCVEVVNTCPNSVPLEGCFFGITAEHIGNIGLQIKENIHDGVAG